MRKLVLVLMAVFSFAIINSVKANNKFFYIDTTHEVDGNIKEWKDSSFIKDAATNISYAIANTGSQLYVALKCTDQRIQVKIMQLGMQMYINEKGKHRESMGIGFPIKNSNEGASQQSGRNLDNVKHNPQSIRQMFAMNLFSMNLFGFDGIDDKKQGLSIEGSVNIAFSWDDNNVMYIEYGIPLSYINSNVTGLNGKSIAIGWKLNGIESQSYTVMPSIGGGGRAGRGGGGSRGDFNTSSGNRNNLENMMKEQIFWDKYDIKF
ncbi:MAG: hypothetical protein JSR09_11405 [Bacteroidetes bacterium]|nr:hypothetical protein [Bacteroidota bacterium]MBS1650299.1 hypothetical protein [Bacteroidota bacterium]